MCPVYEFQCQNSECNNVFSEFFHVTEEPKEPACPKCLCTTTNQLLGSAVDWNPASAVFNGKWDWVTKRVERDNKHREYKAKQ